MFNTSHLSNNKKKKERDNRYFNFTTSVSVFNIFQDSNNQFIKLQLGQKIKTSFIFKYYNLN